MTRPRWPALLATMSALAALGAPALPPSAVLGAGQAASPSAHRDYGTSMTGAPGPHAHGGRVTTRHLRAMIATSGVRSAGQWVMPQRGSTIERAHTAGRSTDGNGSNPSAAVTFPTLSFCGSPACSNPPDGGFAVGPSSLLVAVNHRFAFYDRSGHMLLGPINFYDFFGPPSGAYDPRALYDASNGTPGGFNGGHGRFILLGLTNDKSARTSTYLLAVSQTEAPQSATSGWCTYRLNGAVSSGSVAAYADFPDIGMDGQNLYVTSEELSFSSSSFVMHRLLVIPKASVYPNASTGACPTATSTDFKPLLNPDGGLAYDVEPANQPDALPGQSTPMYLVNALMNGGSQLAVRAVTLSPSPQLNPPSWVSVPSYDPPDNAVQPGGNPIANSGTSLQDASYRYGAIYGANITEHASSSLSPAANPYANVQWYKIDPVALTAQSHVITNPNVAYFTPNIMAGCATATTPGPDGVPRCASPFAALEVSGTGPSQPTSAYYALNGGAPTLYEPGVSGYSSGNNPNLWGDYPGVSADPTTASTVWLLGEFAQTTTGWGTGVTSLSAAIPPATNTPTATSTPPPTTPTALPLSPTPTPMATSGPPATTTPLPSATTTPLPSATTTPLPSATNTPPLSTPIPTSGSSQPTTIPPPTATTGSALAPPHALPVSTPVPPAPTQPAQTPVAPSPTADRSGCASTALPLAIHTEQRDLFSGDTLNVRITTAAYALGDLTIQVTSATTIIPGTGTPKRTLVLYRVIHHVIADGQGQVSAAIHVTYQPRATTHADVMVTARTACGSATRHNTVTITPLFATHLTARSVAGGGTLAVNVYSLSQATVSLTLEVTTTKIVVTGHGTRRKHVAHSIVLYRASARGTANKQGAFSTGLRVSYKPRKAVLAMLTVIVHAGHHATTQRLTVTVQPPHHHGYTR